MKFFIIFFIITSAVHADQLYYDLLKKSQPEQALVLLGEYKYRKISPHSYLTELFIKGNAAIRARLLEQVPYSFIEKEKWLEKVPLKNLKTQTRNLLWLRFQKSQEVPAEILEKSATYFNTSSLSEKKTISNLHLSHQSPRLSKSIKKVQHWHRTPIFLNYIYTFEKKIKENHLQYTSSDSSALALIKIKIIKKEKLKNLHAGFFNAPTAIKSIALSLLNPDELKNYLTDKHILIRCHALENYFSHTWDQSLAETTLQKATWPERQKIVKAMLQYHDQITLEWLNKLWKSNHQDVKKLILYFISKSPKKEYWPLLRTAFNEKTSRLVTIRSLTHFTPFQKSDWILKEIEAKAFSEIEREEIFKLLYRWHEVEENDRYLSIFQKYPYNRGLKGGGVLLKLIGMSKTQKASDLILKYLNHNEKNPYASQAVEAAGWHGASRFSKRIRALHSNAPEHSSNPVVRWAYQRCQGQDIPFPLLKSQIKPNLSYSSQVLP